MGQVMEGEHGLGDGGEALCSLLCVCVCVRVYVMCVCYVCVCECVCVRVYVYNMLDWYIQFFSLLSVAKKDISGTTKNTNR